VKNQRGRFWEQMPHQKAAKTKHWRTLMCSSADVVCVAMRGQSCIVALLAL